MRMMRFLLGATLVGSGAVAVACSSSSSPANGGSDASSSGGSSGGTSSGGSSSGGSSSGGAEDAGGDVFCAPLPANPATLDGGALWGCYQVKCAMSLNACAADCVCNNAFVSALSAIQMMGQSSATMELTTASGSGSLGTAVGSCLVMVQTAGTCNPPADGGGEGGGEGGGHDGAATDSGGGG